VLPLLLACATPKPPVADPSLRIDAVLADEIRMVRRRLAPPVDDENACLGVRNAVHLGPRLQDHLSRVRARSADPAAHDAAVRTLVAGTPGLRTRPGHAGDAVDVDWPALAAATDPRAVSPLLHAVGDLLGPGEGCWHPADGAAALRRLPPLWAAADECARDLLLPLLLDRVRADVDCACPGEDVEPAALTLDGLPWLRGAESAARLRATVAPPP
jgi:hypothetical protein